jgi:2-isopropylmalate synthase
VFHCRASARMNGAEQKLTGEGNGPIAAFVHALQSAGAPLAKVANFKQHALSSGTEASAISYIQLQLADGTLRWGAGVDTNIEIASIKAVISALNRAS